MSLQTSLFAASHPRTVLSMPDAEVWLEPHFLDPSEASRATTALRDRLPWRQEQIRLYGKTHPVPRLTCWLGDGGQRYRYSGIDHVAEPWGPVEPLLRRVEAATGARFNSALANRYRNGADTVGWHADDEPELGPRPGIASLSLGGPRRFVLRHRSTRQKVDLMLPSGSLLWMGGDTQACWEHTVPRTRRPTAERINITFRMVVR